MSSCLDAGASSLVSSQTFRRALTASVDSCAEMKSGVTGCGRGWRQVLESEAWSMVAAVTTALTWSVLAGVTRQSVTAALTWSVLAAVTRQRVTTALTWCVLATVTRQSVTTGVNLECTSGSHSTERDCSVNLECTSSSHSTARDYRR